MSAHPKRLTTVAIDVLLVPTSANRMPDGGTGIAEKKEGAGSLRLLAPSRARTNLNGLDA